MTNEELTVLTLGNAGELSRLVVQQILPDELTGKLDGAEITTPLLYELSQLHFQKALTHSLGQ